MSCRTYCSSGKVLDFIREFPVLFYLGAPAIVDEIFRCLLSVPGKVRGQYFDQTTTDAL
jgi:hypothetical protein